MKLKNLLSLLLIVIFSFPMVACGKNKNSNELSKYYYDSNGSYIGYLKNDFLYSHETNKAIAKYDSSKKAFFGSNGKYLADIYNDCYLVYNENSVNIDETIDIGLAPISGFEPHQPNKTALDFSTKMEQYNKVLLINPSNIEDYFDITYWINGWAAFYVYVHFKAVVKTSKDIIFYDELTIDVELDAKYKAISEKDSSIQRTFSKTDNAKITFYLYDDSNEGTGSCSLYNLNHSGYWMYEFTQATTLTIKSASTLIVLK